jgi:hypothetical protein
MKPTASYRSKTAIEAELAEAAEYVSSIFLTL